jgi:hypothetical protein
MIVAQRKKAGRQERFKAEGAGRTPSCRSALISASLLFLAYCLARINESPAA